MWLPGYSEREREIEKRSGGESWLRACTECSESGQTFLGVMPCVANRGDVLTSHAPALMTFDPLLNSTAHSPLTRRSPSGCCHLYHLNHFTRSHGLAWMLHLWGHPTLPQVVSPLGHGLPLGSPMPLLSYLPTWLPRTSKRYKFRLRYQPPQTSPQ